MFHTLLKNLYITGITNSETKTGNEKENARFESEDKINEFSSINVYNTYYDSNNNLRENFLLKSREIGSFAIFEYLFLERNMLM